MRSEKGKAPVERSGRKARQGKNKDRCEKEKGGQRKGKKEGKKGREGAGRKNKKNERTS